MKLETFGKIIAAGFGNRILVGIFVGLLNNVTPARAYEYIKDNLKLGYWLSDDDWKKYSRMAKSANVGDMTTEDIIKELRKKRLDILGVILNHPDGEKWLDNQVIGLKKKLLE